MTKLKLLGCVGVVAVGLATIGYQVYTRHSAAASSELQLPSQQSQVSVDLRQVMQAKVHEDYTYLSFTIWHDRPLTSSKMDSIAVTSGRILSVAKGLDSYEAAYRQQGWSPQDIQFFDEKRLQLSRVAEELQKAAQKHDGPQVINFFMHLDNTCQSCHKRFRPDLSWT